MLIRENSPEHQGRTLLWDSGTDEQELPGTCTRTWLREVIFHNFHCPQAQRLLMACTAASPFNLPIFFFLVLPPSHPSLCSPYTFTLSSFPHPFNFCSSGSLFLSSFILLFSPHCPVLPLFCLSFFSSCSSHMLRFRGSTCKRTGSHTASGDAEALAMSLGMWNLHIYKILPKTSHLQEGGLRNICCLCPDTSLWDVSDCSFSIPVWPILSPLTSIENI